MTAGLAVPVPGDRSACHLAGESGGPSLGEWSGCSPGGRPVQQGWSGGGGPSRERLQMDFTRRECQAPAGHFANNVVSLDSAATLGR